MLLVVRTKLPGMAGLIEQLAAANEEMSHLTSSVQYLRLYCSSLFQCFCCTLGCFPI